MTTSTDVRISKTDLATTHVEQTELPDLVDGQALLRIEKFALTANNITYAVVGGQMGYWNFFPAEEGWGRVPVWGFAEVVESQHEEITVGERLYGYLPMSSHLIVEPGKVTPATFSDMAAHRQPMSPIYNNYRRLSADPAHNADLEEYRALFEPLFMTSFLIEAFMRKEDFHGASSLLLTSASSKTGMALAECAKATSPNVERIGLTSAGNVEYVEGLGLYDKVVAYDAIDTLDASVASVVVDFAGNGATLGQIHNHFGDQLKYSCLVGATHWEERGMAGDMAGPAPILFFAPDHALAMSKELGPEQFQSEMARAWVRFIGGAQGWVDIVQKDGSQCVEKIYAELLAGDASPRDGFILSV